MMSKPCEITGLSENMFWLKRREAVRLNPHVFAVAAVLCLYSQPSEEETGVDPSTPSRQVGTPVGMTDFGDEGGL